MTSTPKILTHVRVENQRYDIPSGNADSFAFQFARGSRRSGTMWDYQFEISDDKRTISLSFDYQSKCGTPSPDADMRGNLGRWALRAAKNVGPYVKQRLIAEGRITVRPLV